MSGSVERGGAITLESVNFTYDRQEMYFDIAVAAGTSLALVGPSGAGKSTLLNLIAGFSEPRSGRVLIDGRDLSGLPPAARPVTMLFQEHNLFSHLTAAQNVGLGLDPGLRLNQEDQSRVTGALARMGLESLENRLPAQLSGGQRQRVALARSFVRRRPVLLLDEPFAALDPGLRNEMLALLADLRQDQSFTLIIVTHDPRDALKIAERAAFICEGQILAEEGTEALLSRTNLVELNAFLGRRAGEE
ncbi:MAG: thiamine ABC transporter ATP-binding protein [Pseudomonadota bacterium]